MLRDIWTITSKEASEYFGLFFDKGHTATNLLVFIGLGILIPLLLGDFGVETGLSFVSIFWLPFYYASNIVVDSFAGERERHTLETLLATRISEYAVLVGKIQATVIYSFILSMGCYLLSLIFINMTHLFHSTYRWVFPSIGVIAVSLAISIFFSILGVLVCLRAPTVRQATQHFQLGTFISTLPLFLIPVLINILPPETIDSALNAFYDRYLFLTGIILIYALTFTSVGIFVWAKKRFKRKHLIMD